ncbi:hypothetical protein WA026_019683 [Henosepilachna vigintioctopunctata]|uniref:Major facilitator superfamily (MFS) profile domain-containing protein n=1 Tax=Henosepilachna vigintioctopunctata TaxID=420089 RepID=A0AAW1UQQ1_9CUCU
MTYWKALKLYAKNKDFIVILCTLGVAYGQWNYFMVMIAPMISEAFPDEDNSLAGILSSVATISGGCFGTLIFGYLLDRTHKFKLISFLVLLFNLIFSIGEVIALLMSNKIATCITVALYGFCSGSLMVIAYEYTTEVTYPVPEAFGGAILNVVIYTFAIIYVQVLTFVFDSAGYFTGYCIMIASLAIATFPILLMSSELKRRDANIGKQVDGGI